MSHTANTPPPAPEGLRGTGGALWGAIVRDFDLADHEAALLREACRTADAIDALQALLDSEGMTSESSQGMRVHPALVELRQQRITLARLFAAMQLPAGEDADQDQGGPVRPVRGVYAIRGAS